MPERATGCRPTSHCTEVELKRNLISRLGTGGSYVNCVDSEGKVFSNVETQVHDKLYVGGDTEVTGHVKIDDILKLTGVSSDPGTPDDGDVWHNTTENEIRVRLDGTTYSLDVTAI